MRQSQFEMSGRAEDTDLRRFASLFLRCFVVLVIAGAFVYLVAKTTRWVLMIDSPVMHYVVFLMHHGFKPFTQITDNNMPGAYLTEAWAMKVFGGTDIAWRGYEFFLLFCLVVSMSIIARSFDWVAGVFAGGLFMVMHVSEGPWVAAEREEALTVLLAIGLAALFYSVRRNLPWFTFVFGLAGALAASIKPTFFPLPLLLLGTAAFHVHRDRGRTISFVLYGSAGIGVVLLINIAFLVHYGAVGSFVFLIRNVLPNYASLPYAPQTATQLIQLAAPPWLILLAAAAGAIFVFDREGNWEKSAIALTALSGLFSYFVQRKGFQHHRYTFVAFLLLLVGIEIFRGLKRSTLSYVISILAISFSLLHVVPAYLRILSGRSATSVLTAALESDLLQLGTPPQLQRKVECFDMVFGCISALYHLQIVGNSGFTGDLLFFSHTNTVASYYYKERFWKNATEHPPEIIVVSNEWFGHNNSFDKLQAWPEFQTYLSENFCVVTARSFPTELIGRGQIPWAPDVAPAYRIYVRRHDHLHRATCSVAPSSEASHHVSLDPSSVLLSRTPIMRAPRQKPSANPD